jgi:hypothetical protein
MFDSRQATMYRLSQSMVAAGYMNPEALDQLFGLGHLGLHRGHPSETGCPKPPHSLQTC